MLLFSYFTNFQLVSGNNGYDFKAVKRWTSIKKLKYTLLECDKVKFLVHHPFLLLLIFALLNMHLSLTWFFFWAQIFVPIHQEIHWCLAVINKKDKKFQYLDSLRGKDMKVLNALACFSNLTLVIIRVHTVRFLQLIDSRIS